MPKDAFSVVRQCTIGAAIAWSMLACSGVSGGAEAGREGEREAAGLALGAGARRCRTVLADSLERPGYPITLAPVVVRPVPHPLAVVDDTELSLLLQGASDKLGSAAVGPPNRGRLVNARQIGSGPGWEVIDASRAWATEETIEGLAGTLSQFHMRFPDAPILYVGDLSRREGGRLRPHRSHQTGRDVDLGYCYRHKAGWYIKATAETLSASRTWALLQLLISEGDVEYVFMDVSVQELLRAYAEGEGYQEEFLNSLLGGRTPQTRALIRHASGHLTHMHIRYFSDGSEETGRRMAGIKRGRLSKR